MFQKIGCTHELRWHALAKAYLGCVGDESAFILYNTQKPHLYVLRTAANATSNTVIEGKKSLDSNAFSANLKDGSKCQAPHCLKQKKQALYVFTVGSIYAETPASPSYGSQSLHL